MEIEISTLIFENYYLPVFLPRIEINFSNINRSQITTILFKWVEFTPWVLYGLWDENNQ